jgi:methionine aminopeptidase
MSVQTPEELAARRRAGRAVAATLREVARRVRPGVTTAELDGVCADAAATFVVTADEPIVLTGTG